MRVLAFIVLSLFLMAVEAKAQQTRLTFPLTQNLTLHEFVQFENSKGASIEQYGSNMTVTVSKNIYPYVDKYNLAQPLHGSWTTDSVKISFECYFTQSDSIVKYVSYNLGPDRPSLEEVFEQLQREGKTSQQEINKAIEQLENDPQLSQQNTAIYQQLENYFSGRLGEPTSTPNEKKIVEHIRLSWERDNLHVLLAYEGRERRKSSVIMRIYWK